ncbi:MAG: ribosome maturation factor RimM [Cyanobacteria bacterium P01_H01_bin.58]
MAIDAENQDWLEIGRIVAPQGLDGSVRVYPSSDFPERFLEPGDRWLCRPQQAEPEPIQLLSGRYLEGKGLYILKLAGVSDRNQAASLKDAKLYVPRSDRLPVDPDEFHVADLLGLEVRLQTNGTTIGTIIDVYSAGNDLLAIELLASNTIDSEQMQQHKKSSKKKRTQHSLPVLVPFVKEIVPIVNLKAGYVEIDPPQGLLPTR